MPNIFFTFTNSLFVIRGYYTLFVFINISIIRQLHLVKMWDLLDDRRKKVCLKEYVWRQLKVSRFSVRWLLLPHFLILKEILKWTNLIKKGKSRSQRTWEILQSSFPEWNARLPATTESISLFPLITTSAPSAAQTFPKERRHHIARSAKSQDRCAYTNSTKKERAYRKIESEGFSLCSFDT